MNSESTKLKEFLMGVTKKEVKDYTITRNSFWKFWQIDELELNLTTRYEDAYEEVEKKLINGSQITMELKSWVIEDVREQLAIRVQTYRKEVAKAKKLKVSLGTREDHQYYFDSMNFYIRDGHIYFDLDDTLSNYTKNLRTSIYTDPETGEKIQSLVEFDLNLTLKK